MINYKERVQKLKPYMLLNILLKALVNKTCLI